MKKEDIKTKIDKIVSSISKDSGAYMQYWGEDENKFIYDISIGRSSITFNYKTGEFTIYMCHSNYDEMYKPYKSKDAKEFIVEAKKLIENAIKEYKYDNRFYLEDIANKIEKATGMSWNYIGEDNNSLTLDFDYNISYMKNLGGKGLQFTLAIDKEAKNVINIVENDETKFVKRVIAEYKKATTKNMMNTEKNTKSTPNKEIIARAKELIKNKQNGTIRIYEDNCWWSDVEYFSNGMCRFWVGFEDKRTGQTGGSLFSIYDLLNKRYACEFKVKEVVKNKVFSTCTALYKAGLYR